MEPPGAAPPPPPRPQPGVSLHRNLTRLLRLPPKPPGNTSDGKTTMRTNCAPGRRCAATFCPSINLQHSTCKLGGLLFLLGPWLLLAGQLVYAYDTYVTGELPEWYQLDMCRDADGRTPTGATAYRLKPPVAVGGAGSACPLILPADGSPFEVALLPADGFAFMRSRTFRPVIYLPNLAYLAMSYAIIDAAGTEIVAPASVILGP